MKKAGMLVSSRSFQRQRLIERPRVLVRKTKILAGPGSLFTRSSGRPAARLGQTSTAVVRECVM